MPKNVVLRFSDEVTYKKGEEDIFFETNENIKEFFSKIIYKQNCYFYFSQPMVQIKENSILYFVFKQEIVVVAEYTGNDNPVIDRNFDYGYQIKNIRILEKPIKYKTNIFLKGINPVSYIDTEKKELEEKSWKVYPKN